MMARPVALYLTRFDAETAADPLRDAADALDLSPLWTPEQEREDPEAALTAARDAGRAEGAESARAEAAAELEQARRDFGAQLAAERQNWAQAEAEALKQNLATALQQMEDRLAECIARILCPFIIESLRRQMIAELIEHVRSLVASHDAMTIRISGPADLLALLREKLGELPVAIDYEQNESVDVRVMAEETMVETRLKAWIDLISAKLE